MTRSHLATVVFFGLGTFWPVPIVRTFLCDNSVAMGEDTREETYRPSDAVVEDLNDSLPAAVRKAPLAPLAGFPPPHSRSSRWIIPGTN